MIMHTEFIESKCDLYLVRHGETVWNQERKLSGHSDIPLTPKGEAQALQTAEKLRRVNFTAAFSSDLSRACRTAEIIMMGRDVPVQTTTALRERNFGQFEGSTHEIVLALQMNNYDYTNFKPDSSFETDDEVNARVVPFLSKIATENLGQAVLVSTHYGIIRLLLVRLDVISRRDFPRIENGAYLRLAYSSACFSIDDFFGIDIKLGSD